MPCESRPNQKVDLHRGGLFDSGLFEIERKLARRPHAWLWSKNAGRKREGRTDEAFHRLAN